jgi:CheY-like chemotaxis protein
VNTDSAPNVVVLETDLPFLVRIESVVQAAGAVPVFIGNGDALWQAIDRWPELVAINLATAGWKEPVRRAKNLPHTRHIPIVGYGSHVEVQALQAARAAGCDHAWERSRFASELPDCLQRVLHPPRRWVEGWDAPAPPALCRGVEQFNAGEYWECHETLEELWIAEHLPVRELYQGILQVGVGFYHLCHRNYPGTVKMLRRGLPRLRDLPENCQGIRSTELYEASRIVHNRVVELGPERIDEFDLSALPKIALAGC